MTGGRPPPPTLVTVFSRTLYVGKLPIIPTSKRLWLPHPCRPVLARQGGINPSMRTTAGVCRISLHDVILRRTGHAVFVRPVVHHRDAAAEIVMRRRRGNRPLQRGRFPGIHFRLLALEHAP